MSEESVRKVLRDFGLTEKEVEIYIFLAKHGNLRSGEISKRMGIDKAEVYRIIKNLQAKTLVEATLEAPTRFTAVELEKVIDSFIRYKRDEATLVENTKQDLLKDWKNITRLTPESAIEKFTVIEGRRKIYPRIFQMVKETRKQLSSISSVTNLLRGEQFGLLDAIYTRHLKSGVEFRFLTEVSDQNMKIVEEFLRRISKTALNIKGRNHEAGIQVFPQMVIRDGEELLLFINSRPERSEMDQDQVGLWTNCRTLAQSFATVFEGLWRDSLDLDKRIAEIVTGKPRSETYVMRDAKSTRKDYEEILQAAKDEIIFLTSSLGLTYLLHALPFLKSLAEKGVSIRMMAPITRENLEEAKQLLEFCSVRHVPWDYRETTIIDGKQLFQSRKSPREYQRIGPISHFDDVFYTNDVDFVGMKRTALNDLWGSSQVPSVMTLESLIGSSGPTIFPISDDPHLRRSNVVSLEDKPQGTITEADVLNKIVTGKRHLVKDLAKDVNVMYASGAMGVVHPPSHFNLPDMMFVVNHIDKQSSFGQADALEVYLWLETPKGYAFVPVGGLGDNPRGVAFRKTVHAGTPLAQNHKLVKKNELQVRVYGTTLFAGWTVPIQLYPSKYVLPPACLLIEGYGKVNTQVRTVVFSSGLKSETEQNWFYAFVTFMHPDSKYSGPGTDGFFVRDQIVTMNYLKTNLLNLRLNK